MRSCTINAITLKFQGCLSILWVPLDQNYPYQLLFPILFKNFECYTTIFQGGLIPNTFFVNESEDNVTKKFTIKLFVFMPVILRSHNYILLTYCSIFLGAVQSNHASIHAQRRRDARLL